MTIPAPLPESRNIALARKLVLLSLLMIITPLGLVVFFLNIDILYPLLALAFADIVIGIVSGFSVRKTLGKRTGFLRIVTILAFIIGGLSLTGWFTGWRYGIGPLRFGSPSVDWLALAQFLLATLIALLVLFAWSRPRQVPAPAPAASPKRRSPNTRASRPSTKRAQRSKSKAAPAVASRAAHPRSARAVEEPPTRPLRKRIGRRRLQIQLSQEEEHRCPYCLEPIVPDDPRGTVECKVCHTLHHADCWAITGVCQVPHYTS